MEAECIAPARDWLARNSPLAPAQRNGLAALLPLLLRHLPAGQPAAIGIAGAPGSGKSTLAGMLAACLDHSGHTNVVLSLDDYYLPRARREELAVTRHPLFAQRGVPGTHDLQRLCADLRALLSGATTLDVPVFDKAGDDRCSQARKIELSRPVAFVLLEGWLAGLPPQNTSQLRAPVNTLEAREDAHGHWRRAVNEALTLYDDRLWSLLSHRWLLAAPGWQQVVDWRWQQEQAIDPKQRYLRSREEVEQFLARFERLVGHLHRSSPGWADLTLYLDAHHQLHGEPVT